MPLVERRCSEKIQNYKQSSDAFFNDSDDDENEETSILSPAVNKRKASYAKEFDPVTFCVTKVDPKDFANQLTLLDLPVFKAIKPDELSSCAWNTKDKMVHAPNVVAFIRRFNQVCLWCQKEIISRDKVKLRGEILSHFIKIARKLLQLNNLHSAFAILSALQSTAIHPLTKTWAELSSKERNNFEKMCKLFSDENNFDRLRRYMENVKLPCIPYLGLYLTDLIYVDVAHPSSGGLESTQRSLLMNNILRILSDLQHSTYENIFRLEHLQTYLKSVRYIDELQKFVEEDLYNKSVELEPRIVHKDSSFSNPQPLQLNIVDATLSDEMSNLNMNDSSNAISAKDFVGPLKKIEKLKSHSLTPQIEKCRKGHRKTMSLGSNVPKNLKRMTNDFYNPNETLPVVLDSRRHLLDDSLLDCSLSCTAPSSTLSSSHINPIHENVEDSGNESEHRLYGRKNPASKKNSSADHHDVNDCTTALLLNSPGSASECLNASSINDEKAGGASCCTRPRRLSRPSPGSALIFEGAVRKKTVMKNGVKKGNFFPVYNRYWLRLKSSCHVTFYSAKKFAIRNLEARISYRSKPSEVISIANWMILEPDGPYHRDTFYMQEPTKGFVYKIRTGSEQKAKEWVHCLKLLIKNHQASAQPSNLMTFD